MCCFSRPVVSVSATNIFAREAQDGRQHLAYSMKLSAVHIHGGHVHPHADFDHALFCQWPDRSGVGAHPPGAEWGHSIGPAGFFVDVTKSRGLIDPNARCYRRRTLGRAENRDVYVDA